MIPEKYLALQRKIIAEASHFRSHKEKRGPPILSWKQIQEYEYCVLLDYNYSNIFTGLEKIVVLWKKVN